MTVSDSATICPKCGATMWVLRMATVQHPTGMRVNNKTDLRQSGLHFHIQPPSLHDFFCPNMECRFTIFGGVSGQWQEAQL